MGSLVTFLPIIVIMVALMWWMQRSQKKQQQKRQEQLSTMSSGDEVVTIGGLHGVIDSLDSVKKTVDIDCDGVILTYEMSAIRSFNKPAVAASAPEVEENKIESPIEEEK
ncbi:MAG: preprotein translocase subunit YajC [Streptococcaceae bacterium]|jgi:preprotein translocase subunit YajC|nr:preprotein translocase subunit YajC [Streptococcaceae bacterium]